MTGNRNRDFNNKFIKKILRYAQNNNFCHPERSEGSSYAISKNIISYAINKQKLQFLSIGHFTHDIVDGGLILGGAAAYSSMTARKFGLNVGVVTSVGSDFQHYDKLNGISLSVIGSDVEGNGYQTTTFQNIYENGVRKQFIRGVSATINAGHIPKEWHNSEITYLCPVADEIDASVVDVFKDSIIGVSPQGWMRRWDTSGHVYAKRWENAHRILPYVDALIMSEEDIIPFPDVVEEYANLTRMMVLTRGEKGSTLYCDGKIIDFPAFRVNIDDPTGAGDVFATAFLIRYKQTRDPYDSSRFANCTASFVVEKSGTEGIPSLDQIMERLQKYID